MRPIDADALIDKAYLHGGNSTYDNPYGDGIDAVDVKDIEAAPTLDAEPVRHGRWFRHRYSTPWGFEEEFVCSLCKRAVDFEENYCPSCGAKMDLEGKTKYEFNY